MLHTKCVPMSDTIPAVLLEDVDQEREADSLQLDAKPDVGEVIEHKGTEYVVENVVHNDTKWAGRLGVVVDER